MIFLRIQISIHSFIECFFKKKIEKDSNEREILAAKETIFGAKSILKHSVFTLHVDNSTTCKIISKGSSKLRLHLHALQIDNFCLDNDIKLKCVNIPRDLNCVADEISKIVDYEDYSVEENFFNTIKKEINMIPTCDRFADNYNSKVNHFNSKSFYIGTSGVNSFNYDWGPPHINWIFPAPRLLTKSLNHLKLCKGIGIFLTPEWKGSEFYPYFCNEIKNRIFFKRYSGKNMFKQGSDKESFFGPNFNAAVNVWIFDFNC